MTNPRRPSSSRTRRVSAPSPVRLRIELVLAVGLTGFLLLASLGGILNLTGVNHSRGSAGAQIITLAIVALLAFASTRWLISIEHRLRAHQPVAQTFSAQGLGAPEGTGAGVRPLGRRRRRYGPHAAGWAVLLLGAGTVGFTIGAISDYVQAQRSSYVQTHGVSDVAAVTAVHNDEHCSRGGCSYTAAIDVTLAAPVQGVSRTTVHFDGYSDLQAGEPLTVVVDPQQPGYAELPGSPFKRTYSWIIYALVAMFMGGLAAIEIRYYGHLRAHRIRHTAAVGSEA